MGRNIAGPRREARIRRHQRVRKSIAGVAERPRLAVFRSNLQIYAQVIDDEAGHTMVSASTLDGELASAVAGKTRREQAAMVGRSVAERALKVGIESVVFDRGGFQYHGRIKALADAAREAGLKF
ncbi:MAG: 50S ribosomal protein L18 [Anaerolineae bacterium]|nr:50S ribosomal protein L18 [Ardenticatenia bacterium]MBK8539479.1 50S ribosomal protein L18 [Ardenticatenia bacterium]HQZ71340.1 50S ribosomal protein L18 [Anaerolineae bacterium]HRA19631.1 50S ribosomal protein L18 [Anaerolineae bacterium]